MASLRWMIRRDLERVVDIDRASFVDSWDEDTWIKVLRERNTIAYVCEVETLIIGYVCYELGKDYVRILNMAVEESWRDSGYGTQMIDKLYSKLSLKTGRDRVVVTVNERSVNLCLWFKKRGFTCTSICRGHFGSGCDGYIFERKLTHAESR